MNFITTNTKKERTRTAQRTNIEKGLLSLWFLYVQCVQMLIFTNNFKTINREWFMYSSIFKWKTINCDTWKMIAIQHGGQMNVHNHKHSFDKNTKMNSTTIFSCIHLILLIKRHNSRWRIKAKEFNFKVINCFVIPIRLYDHFVLVFFCFFRIPYRQEKQSSMIVQCR